MADGLITPGVVDERDIREVAADDVRGFDRVHFFAGVGGWELALRLAGWGDAPVWTGSCPCQPFSAAGKRKAQEDDRHLWSAFFRLIRECRPQCVFGEQVEGAIRHGWLDGVCADLEAEGYAVGSVVLGAHSVGAPHIRQRLYWVAHAERTGVRGGGRGAAEGAAGRVQGTDGEWQRVRADAEPVGGTGSGRAADSGQGERGRRAEECGPAGEDAGERREEATDHQRRGATGGLADPDRGRAEGEQRGEGGADGELRGLPQVHGRGADERVPTPGASPLCGLGDADDAGPQGRGVRDGGRADERAVGSAGCPPADPWSDSVLIPCRDGKCRRVPAAQPGVLPVADGLPAVLDDERGACGDRFPLAGAVTGRVALLRGVGNAIVPQVAAEFIRAVMEESS
ncbi:MAG TPA: DNA cytosine methyltransferase [Gemmata sp.]|nr:DNA cytosine methyltransferase [Gemmata sp.]